VIIIYLLVFVLNQVEFLDKILVRFLDIGISGATIIDSTGMGRTLTHNHDVPIFGGLGKMFENCHPNNKTIFSVIKTEKALQEATKVIEEEVGDINDLGVGILFTIPLHSVVGLPKNNTKENK